jgi:hypothetical protein
VQNSTLHANETGRNVPPKCRGLSLLAVFGTRYIPLQHPAIVCQHTWSSLVSLPLFHSHYLVKSFTMFVTDYAEIFLENIQVWLQKVGFQAHIASHSFVRSQHILHNIRIWQLTACYVSRLLHTGPQWPTYVDLCFHIVRCNAKGVGDTEVLETFLNSAPNNTS